MPSRVSIPTVSRTRFFTLILLSGNLSENSDTTLLPKRRQTKPGKCVPEQANRAARKKWAAFGSPVRSRTGVSIEPSYKSASQGQIATLAAGWISEIRTRAIS